MSHPMIIISCCVVCGCICGCGRGRGCGLKCVVFCLLFMVLKILFKLTQFKLKTASVGVNLHSLMVRFSFARDCGSIPHGDSTVSVFVKVKKHSTVYLVSRNSAAITFMSSL